MVMPLWSQRRARLVIMKRAHRTRRRYRRRTAYGVPVDRAVVVSVDIPAPPAEVWADIAQLDSHVEWMADAREIEFLTRDRAGVGTRMRVDTRLGPLRTSDVMEVTAWEPPVRMAVSHTGVFTGEGEFALVRLGPAATRFTWRERIAFPWYLDDLVAAAAARPILRLVWRRNLAGLRARFTSP